MEDCLGLGSLLLVLLLVGWRLCALGHMASVDSLVEVSFLDLDAALGRTTRAHGQDEVGVLRADHGSGIIRGVVGSAADRFASWAVDGNAGWVIRVVLHRGDNLHATGREGIAVDVGEVIRDLAVGPSELELGDRSRDRVIWRKLDGDTNTFLVVSFAEAALEFSHAGGVALANRRIVNGKSAVVDNGSGSNSHDRGSRGKQHGCASKDVLGLHFLLL